MHAAMQYQDEPSSPSSAPGAGDDARTGPEDVLRSLGFETRLHAGLAIEGGRTYHAELFRGQELMCKLTLSGHYPDEAAAIAALRKRLGQWVAEYQGRIG